MSKLQAFREAVKAKRAYSLKVLSDSTPVDAARAELKRLEEAEMRAFRAYKKSPEYN